ncbi:hypothetical protein TAMA11512_10590 [Selenomonas sp. TAMA-11512]|nr:hypothetical protein TAMA11512_10590 [Selenomonas sp. TAMA-11512]
MASGKNYGEVAKKYNVSYQQVRSWTLRYETLGEAGLEDRRGIRKKDQVPRTELEMAQIKIEKLKHQLYMAEMERDLLKKLNELERKDLLGKREMFEHTEPYGTGIARNTIPFMNSVNCCRCQEQATTSGHRGKRVGEIAKKVEEIHKERLDKGYRRINDD